MCSRCRGDGVDTLGDGVMAASSREDAIAAMVKLGRRINTRKSAASADVPILKRNFEALVTSWTSSWGDTTLLKLSRDHILRNNAPNSRTRGVGSL